MSDAGSTRHIYGRIRACVCALAAGLLFAGGLALPDQSLARTVLDLSTPALPVDLMDWGDYRIEGVTTLSPSSVAAFGDTGWQPTRANMIYPLKTGQSLWIRFTVPPAPDNERWYLEVPYPSVNRVSLFTLDSADQWNEQSAGDTIAVNAWPVPHRHPLLPVNVSAEEPKKYLVRVENPYDFGAPLRFVSESYLSRNEQRTSLILGIYFGLAGLAVMLAALSAVSLRDSAYGLYAVSVALMALTQAAITGIAGLHLWPEFPAWNDLSALVLPVLTVASLLWFSSAVVSMPARSRRLHQLLTGLGFLGIAAGVGIALTEPSQRFYLMVPYIVVSMVVATLTLLWARRRGDRYGGWLLFGSLPLIAASMFPLARLSGMIPVSFLTMYGMQIGVAIELPIVMVILMLRSQHRRENMRRIQGLDRVDPATGLINEPVFAERLMRMIARSERLRHQSAVLMIDLVNTEQIQRDFGRRAAEELPLRMAARLLSTAREIDSAARLSEQRFGMLVEGPVSPEEAATLGPRIVARCLMPYKGLPEACVAQVRVAYALVPRQGPSAEIVLARLAQRLTNIPPESKRAVFLLPDYK
ncbi:MAG: 7TM diverse intracellular signaling domain-containing protein [Polaromonas sp.]|uniref:sensor domain-containing diguanylate cyclase n=1 Tax=Polaromonas sp. TaxID=1869339 RepID=UPI002736E4F4|nr:7TM diverse intracellular signaling domain-containing protein [Polaromonas sp.]MDP2819395.1 7TM diverse intracellular signaling domain-containing protein [Polaromonas sp.]